jgi:hypothetical protein
MYSLSFVVFGVVSQTPGSYMAAFCGMTCRRAQQVAFLREISPQNDALLGRAFELIGHESSCTNLLRPCRVY